MTMMAEKASLHEMTEDEKKGLHLNTVDADLSIDDMFGEERANKEKALVKKVDMRMMPLMMLICRLIID